VPAATLRARVLGGFELAVDGRPIPPSAFERPSGQRLLKLLLATGGHRIRREEAAELLWPDADPERSGANLRKAIHFARRALDSAVPGGAEFLVAAGPELRLTGSLEVDADEMLAAIDAAERIGGSGATDALARLAGGELLPADIDEAWLDPIRTSLRERTLAALLAGASRARAGGERERAGELLRRLVGLEPADEAAHRGLIELHLEAGELHAARRQLQSCRQAVVEAYGVEPDPALESLIAEAAARRPAAADRASTEPPIVGRRRELEAAELAFQRVAEGNHGSILLRGPAGIGKSRVLRELVSMARVASWPVLELRGLEDAARTPFAPVAQAIVGALGGAVPPDAPEPARSALLVADPAATDAASLAFGSEGPVQRGLLDAIGLVAPAGRPIAIVVDDAQWLDRASLDLLEVATTGGVSRPCLVLVTVRDEPALVSGPVSVVLAAVDRTRGAEIELGPLGALEVRAIVERDVARAPLDDDLAAAIAEQSAGAPLFAVDLFRSASESGLLERRGDRWGFRKGVGALPVPESVARVVERRITRMGPVARLVLATAAELGDVVEFEDIVATGAAPDDVLDAVDAAIGAGLVRELEGRYAFGHPLYRAALRRGLPPRDRASVHRRIAEMLARGIDPADSGAVRRAGARGVDILAIASHAARAAELGSRDAAQLAVGFGFGAGARQADLFDFAGAIRTLRQALRQWQRLPEGERQRFGVSAVHVRLGEALRRAGDDVGASAALDEAVATAIDDAELATAASAAAWLPYEHGRYEAALALLQRADARIAEPAAHALIDSTRAWILGREGDWNGAIDILTRTVATLDAGGPSPDLMRALDRLAIAYRDAAPSNAFAAIPLLERAIGMAVELGRTGERATYEMHLAGAYQALNRLDDAIATLDRARGLCRLAGEQYIETVVEWVSAEVEQLRGNHAAAIAHRRRELEIFASIGGNARHEALAHAHLAHLARTVGDDRLASAEAEAARVGARHSGIDTLEARVEWALSTDDWFAPQA
jgi:DNA-binding SARP family transcriptional activator/tetratricopeptide (TPR) repeat protein